MSTTSESVLQAYRWASDYINGLIQGPPSPPADATAEEIRARAIARLDRLRAFLGFLGNPQLAFRSIHIGGTSGKGSTSALIASILSSAGYRTGLHVSPYLQVETEKLQINRDLISGDRFAQYVRELDQQADAWVAAGGPRPTYGEFWVALTFYVFARENVEYGVVEVGAGGRFDLTNVLLPDVAVVTSIGLDHVRTLGRTIPEIAWHKAGIIKPGRSSVTTVDDPAALDVIRRESELSDSPLTVLREGVDYELLNTGQRGTRLRDLRTGHDFALPLAGAFQGANAAAAIGAVRALAASGGRPVTDSEIEDGLQRVRFAGRMEIVQSAPQVVLDGAHSPVKMAALAASLGSFQQPSRRVLVLGALDSHDYLEMARIIAPYAAEVIITAPSAIERSSASTEALAEVVGGLGVAVEVIPEPRQAIEEAMARVDTDGQVLVTGSLYLVGLVRERWYPSDQIVLQQTSWPEVPASLPG